MSSNNKKMSASLKKGDVKHPHMGNKTVNELLTNVKSKSSDPPRPKSKYTSRKEKKGGYRYSELGMKGLTIVLTDGAKVMSAKKTKKVVRKGKMTRKGRKGNKRNKGNKKRTTRRRKM